MYLLLMLNIHTDITTWELYFNKCVIIYSASCRTCCMLCAFIILYIGYIYICIYVSINWQECIHDHHVNFLSKCLKKWIKYCYFVLFYSFIHFWHRDRWATFLPCWRSQIIYFKICFDVLIEMNFVNMFYAKSLLKW